MESINISGRLVGPDHPPYIIAEIGSNHNGDIKLAKQLVNTANACGANAVKFQSWSKRSLISRAEYERNTVYQNKKKHFGSLKEMVEKYQLTPEHHQELIQYCQDQKITFLSSCFSPEEVDLLDSLDVPAFKIASMDINHLTLLEYVAEKKKPVILSTGMATLSEIERAIHVLVNAGAEAIALLHCVSIYPPAYDIIHLRNIVTLEQAFDLPVGFSDHTMGTAIPLAAIALGACIIEKHFTLDKYMPGWDHAVSADQHELEIIVKEGNHVFTALGSSVRNVSEDELEKRKAFRRRIVMKHALKAGSIIKKEDLNYKRPGTGIHPDEYRYVLGRILNRDVEDDHELEWDDLK